VKLNPYESPRTEHPQRRSQLIKRSVGLAATLLLTPPAFAIALFTCCAAGTNMGWFDTQFLIPIPPLLLIGMLWLAAYLHGQHRRNSNRKRFLNELIGTPLFMLISLLPAYVCAAFAYFAVSTRGGGQLPGGDWVIMVAFWVPPFLVLILMLRRAWRNR
jgi:hypothetical protein